MYSTASPRDWKESFVGKVAKIKSALKNQIPLVIGVVKELYLFLKELLQAVLDFILACGHQAFNHAKEGLKDEVNKIYFYGFLAVLLWACHWLGLFKGLVNVETHDNPDFDKIMEQVSRDAHGFPVKVELAVLALRFLHQLVIEAKKILMELRKIAKNAELHKSMTESELEALRSRIERIEITVQAISMALTRFEDQVKILKQRFVAAGKIKELPESNQEAPVAKSKQD